MPIVASDHTSMNEFAARTSATSFCSHGRRKLWKKPQNCRTAPDDQAAAEWTTSAMPTARKPSFRVKEVASLPGCIINGKAFIEAAQMGQGHTGKVTLKKPSRTYPLQGSSR